MTNRGSLNHLESASILCGKLCLLYIIRLLPFKMDDPAAMYYDPKTRLLNVVSDFDNILVELILDGDILFTFPVKKAVENKDISLFIF